MFFGGGGMPFDFEGAQGGHPGMGGMGGGGRRRKDVDTTKFYTRLDVAKTASAAEIKKAYRKAAIKHHPDKGGDPETFKDITHAYEVLSDPDKRARYDQGGEDAVSGEGGGDPSDVFDMFFGGGGRRGGGGARRRQKTKDVVHNFKVSLEELYNGGMKKLAVNREVIDQKAGVQECRECDGRGVKIQMIRMGPMVQQAQSPCGACGGQGKSFKTKREREILELHIPKGAPDGHKVVFSGKADEHPDADPGDVVCILNEKPHPVFERRGADLFVKRSITLVEALCGFSLEITHLDKRQLVVKSKEGEITCPQLFDPLKDDMDAAEWEALEDTDCPSVDNVAQAETEDVDQCKKVCEKKDFSAFVVKDGNAFFKQCTRAEAVKGKQSKKGATLYIPADPAAAGLKRLTKACKGEGMPTVKNPFVCGNLFVLLDITFPTEVTADQVKFLKKALPGPKTAVEEDEKAEIHYVQDMDPVASQAENKALQGGAEAYDEDERGHPGMGGQQGVQCNQQ